MHLREGEFEKAHTDFFEAFKNYDESGSPRRTTCLKYLVLANMLMKSGINPFDSQEVRIYLLPFKMFAFLSIHVCMNIQLSVCLIILIRHLLKILIFPVRFPKGKTIQK